MVLKVKVKSLSHVWLFVTPWTIAYQVPPSMGFSRQEYWSGLPFPSPGDLPNPGMEPRSSELFSSVQSSHSVVSNSSWPYGLQPTRLLHPWDFPGKNTEVGCHCLLCVVQECAFFLLFTAASSHLSLEDLSSPMWQKVDLSLTHSDSDWANFLQGVKLAGANKRAHSKYCRSRELSLKNTPYHPSNYVLHKRELT